MRILVAAMGSRGDVQPVVALALALRAAGHDTIVSAPPDFADWIQGLKLRFISCGTNVEQVLAGHSRNIGAHSRKQLVQALRDILLQNLPEVTQRTLDAARGVDAMVCASHFAARTVSEVLSIPYFGVVYVPTMVKSRHHPPAVVQRYILPNFCNGLLWNVMDRVATRAFIDPINVERAKLGLRPATSFQEHFYTGVPCLLACDPVVGPVPPDWSSRDITSTGPWYYDDPHPLGKDVEAFLADGPPPVYVGFGSMVSADAEAATRMVVSGAGASGRRVLLSQGWAGLGAGARSSSVMVVSGSVPHGKLFPRVAAVVHHGGAGTTATALRAGVPQVVVPHILDQYYFAHRLSELGLAPSPLPVRQLSAARLARAIDATLELPPAPRQEAASRLREGNGIQRAVAFIESRTRTP